VTCKLIYLDTSFEATDRLTVMAHNRSPEGWEQVNGSGGRCRQHPRVQLHAR
jgi:hypothetical protein